MPEDVNADTPQIEPGAEATPPPVPSAEAQAEVAPAPEAEATPPVEAEAPFDEVPDEAPEVELPRVEETPIVHKHFVAPALIPLERVDDDALFRVRSADELEDVSALATDLARLGQLFPIDVRLKAPDRFQVITGFRRVAALRFLHREKVLARLHTDLSDADALLMSLASAIHARQVGAQALAALRDALQADGRLSPAARDMLEKALAADDSLAPEQVEEEVDADELAGDVTVRLGQCNQDLALLADVFADLEPSKQEALLTQLRYSIDLVAFLEGKR